MNREEVRKIVREEIERLLGRTIAQLRNYFIKNIK